MLLYQTLSFNIHGKILKKSYKNNKFKISALTWNEEFELPGGSYSVSNVQDYFKYILKKHGEKINNTSIRIYVSSRETRTTFIIKVGYCFELLMPETMKLLGSTKGKINKDKNGENMAYLEITEVVALLAHCNIVKNDYQHDLRVFYTFVPNKSFGQLLDFSLKKFIF